MGKTMKQDQKENSRARFVLAVSEIVDLLERNKSNKSDVPTKITIFVEGASSESLELEIEDLDELLTLLSMNKE